MKRLKITVDGTACSAAPLSGSEQVGIGPCTLLVGLSDAKGHPDQGESETLPALSAQARWVEPSAELLELRENA